MLFIRKILVMLFPVCRCIGNLEKDILIFIQKVILSLIEKVMPNILLYE